MNNRPWYQMTAVEAVEVLGTGTAKGLTQREAQRRLADYGPNQLEQRQRVSPWRILLAQFQDFMVMVLLAATVISGLLGEVADAITIIAIVVVNAVLGFFQEFKAEKSMEALQQLTAPEARVLRDGEERRLPASDLVPGDIVTLETGDRVPADLRLVHAVNLEVEESMLTGESIPVKKRAEMVFQEERGIGDRRNMAYLGTVVTRGRGQGVVVATGMATEMGQIAGMMQEVEAEPTPLQRRLDYLGRWLVVFCLAICAVVVAAGVWRGEEPYRMFLAGVSLAVAAIPEGLPAIVTVSLAIGVQKMIRRQAIIRKLPAVETLGCATVICSDKTGTLTQNEMTVRQVFINDRQLEVTGQGYEPAGKYMTGDQEVEVKKDPHLQLLLKISALCNNARLKKGNITIGGLFRGKSQGNWSVAGDPTEGALLVASAKAGIWREAVEKEEQRLSENPFDSDRKRMSVVYRSPGGTLRVYVKGAPDVVLGLCTHIYEAGKIQPITADRRKRVLEANDRMARQALRVLGMAYRDLNGGIPDDLGKLENDLVFVGLAGMIDPPRPAAVHAVQVCRQAGIKPVMITGDHRATARAVAAELGMTAGDRQVVTGADLDSMSDEELAARVDDISVYARVSPKHKLRIVRALKDAGHVVAMTGDGVNDAPAVKEADIGVSMGLTGTDVTKEASAMVLADDNFATIVAAVEEGRAIYDNIRKFIRYLLSCNVGEVLTMFLVTLAGLPLPLLPIQILWVNLVTDGLPAMALGVDNADPDVMSRRPRSPKESIFAQGLGRMIISRGLYIGLGTPLVFVLSLLLTDGNLSIARTMAFCTLVFSQLFHVFDCKSERYSVFQVGFFSNSYLVLAVMCSVTMQLAVVYIPALQPVFKTVALTGYQWALILMVAGGRTFLKGINHYFFLPVRRKLVYMRV